MTVPMLTIPTEPPADTERHHEHPPPTAAPNRAQPWADEADWLRFHHVLDLFAYDRCSPLAPIWEEEQP